MYRRRDPINRGADCHKPATDDCGYVNVPRKQLDTLEVSAARAGFRTGLLKRHHSARGNARPGRAKR
jgi:hypothetical protein